MPIRDPPVTGRDTKPVLQSWLGLSDNEVAAMEGKKVVRSNNISESYARLKSVTSRGETEVEEMVSFFSQLSKSTSEYGRSLVKLRDNLRKEAASRKADNSESTYTGHGENYVLSTCWVKFRDTVTGMAKDHTNLAATIDSLVLPSLEQLRAQQKDKLARMRTSIKQSRMQYEDRFQQMAKSLPSPSKARSMYDNKSQTYYFQLQNRDILAPQDRSENANRTYKSREEMEKADTAYRNMVTSVEDARAELERVVSQGMRDCEDIERKRLLYVTEALNHFTNSTASIAERMSFVTGEFRAAVESLTQANASDVDLRSYGLEMREAWKGPDKVTYIKDGSEVKDMVFGVDLDRVVPRGRKIPLIVEKCIQAVERRGLDKEGIYRIPASNVNLNTLRTKFEHDESIDLETPSVPEAEDINCVAGMLKMYLRELPIPLFPASDKERMEFSKMTDPNARIARLRDYILSLSPSHRDTLSAVIDHMNRVADPKNQNRMNAASVATVFAPVMFREANAQQQSQFPLLQLAKPPRGAAETAQALADVFKVDCGILEDIMRWSADLG
ncbi:Rho GTPase-activating protein 27 [Gonapodya sp. JEL0774]|nr:Rho GTPase-activating protein 27 [Gonapodya sp. JEL0774]